MSSEISHTSGFVLKSFNNKNGNKQIAVAKYLVFILPQASLKNTAIIVNAINLLSCLIFVKRTARLRAVKCSAHNTQPATDRFGYIRSECFRSCASPADPLVQEQAARLDIVR